MWFKKKKDKNNTDAPVKEPWTTRLIQRVMKWYEYCTVGVMSDPRDTTSVRLIKTANLAVSSFMDRGLQIRSMSLTYNTVLALVPLVALLVAIGRGFGLQNTLMEELYYFFPSQHKVISTALTFVDSYLTNATQGVFVGVGILFLLWTVVSLMSSIEDAFNSIWDVKHDRSFFQKITDYIAICLIVPILMICSSGLSIFMTTVVQDNISLPFLTPVINHILELSPLVLSWLAFSVSYAMIPNTKVNFKYAMIAGAVSAIAFQILQLLFVNGQIYVSKYNAIYGSFAFLPLLLIWLQLSWLLLLSGCVLTYALQNVYTFNFMGDSDDMSLDTRLTMAVIVMSVVIKRFLLRKKPLSASEISGAYNLPIRVVTRIVEHLIKAKLLYYISLKDNSFALTPAIEPTELNVSEFFAAYNNVDTGIKVPYFNQVYSDLIKQLDDANEEASVIYQKILLKDLPIPTPDQISDLLKKHVVKPRKN